MEECKKSSLDGVIEKVAHAEVALDWGPFLTLSPEVSFRVLHQDIITSTNRCEFIRIY